MPAETTLSPCPRTRSSARALELWFEPGAALVATGFLICALVIGALNAGPLWRDETNSINVAQMPSLAEFWHNLRFESFPALWLLLLRLWSGLGLAGSDCGIRALGLVIGLCFPGALWLSTRWVGARAPSLSLALLGSMPAFINVLGSNRAYGLALTLLVLAFGTLWRALERPSPSRIALAALIGLLFLHCVYYDSLFYCGMLFGAALVVLRRRDWKTLAALVTYGALAGLSTAIYLPNIRWVAPYVRIVQTQFDPSMLWAKLNQAVSPRTSAQGPGEGGMAIWLWLLLLLFGLAVALVRQIQRKRALRTQTSLSSGVPARSASADLALFAATSALFGAAAFSVFLLRLRFPTEPWYYMGVLCFCAISLEAVLTAGWPALHPYGFARIGFLFLMMGLGSSAVWAETHTRRSNADVVAAATAEAGPGDLIVVLSAWEGITFDRYYHGRATWMTLPPINSHKVHRTDLIWQQLNERDPTQPVLDAIRRVLESGNRVWVAGDGAAVKPRPVSADLPPPPGLPTGWYLGPYSQYWSAKVMSCLRTVSKEGRLVSVPVPGPVNYLEDLRLLVFWGYQPEVSKGQLEQRMIK